MNKNKRIEIQNKNARLVNAIKLLEDKKMVKQP